MFNLIRKYKRKSIKNNSGFGLTESIISIVLLSVLISYSIIFISKRQETLYRANLTSAINDEIDRDIETIKNNLFVQHFKPKKGNTAAKYDVSRKYCDDLINTFRFFTTDDFSWRPGSNQNSYVGQSRSKVFRGQPVIITRKVVTSRPLGLGSNLTMDRSIAKIVYIVNLNNENIHWSSLDLTSEAHSWCTKG